MSRLIHDPGVRTPIAMAITVGRSFGEFHKFASHTKLSPITPSFVRFHPQPADVATQPRFFICLNVFPQRAINDRLVLFLLHKEANVQVLLNFGEKGKGYILQAKPGDRISVRGHRGTSLRNYFRMVRRDEREGSTYEAGKPCVLVVNGYFESSRWGTTNIVYGVTNRRWSGEKIYLGQYFLSPKIEAFLIQEKAPALYVPESLAYMPTHEEKCIIARLPNQPNAQHTQGWETSRIQVSQILGDEPDLSPVRPFGILSATVI